jgi:sulfide:quinone oxidoreductase
MKVDADYTPKPYEEWKASDWPRTYQNPTYKNLFAAGIAFAPPHIISKPMKSPNGTVINPTPPRTGMPSGIIGKAVAYSVCDLIKNGDKAHLHEASMAEMGAACVASAGKGVFSGTAAAMTVYPVVPDYEKYPGTGRDTDYTFGEIGLAGHWIKHILHHLFIYKAKLNPGWTLIPE